MQNLCFSYHFQGRGRARRHFGPRARSRAQKYETKYEKEYFCSKCVFPSTSTSVCYISSYSSKHGHQIDYTCQICCKTMSLKCLAFLATCSKNVRLMYGFAFTLYRACHIRVVVPGKRAFPEMAGCYLCSEAFHK